MTVLMCALAGCGGDGSRRAFEKSGLITLSEFDSGTRDGAKEPHTATPVFGTYNIHWLQNPAGVRADLARLQFVSVWAFQEVRLATAGPGAEPPAALRTVLPPGKWYIAAMPLNRLRELRSPDFEGQMIVSRFPIRMAEVWPLQSSGPKRRAALAATIDVGGTSVLFVNTDHEPSIFSPTHANTKQTRSLLRHLSERDPGPAVLGGDFNTAGSMPRLVSARGARAGLHKSMAAARFAPAVSPNLRTYRAGFFSATLDHLFTRDVIVEQSGVDVRSTGSDHRPVWCRVRIEGGTTQTVKGIPSASQTASPAAP